MVEDYGEIYPLQHDRQAECLHLSFWPGSLPLQQRWRNNGLSADFLGDYVTTFFPLDDADPATRRRQNEIRGAVGFIANELLENAMKFHDERSLQPITVDMNLQKQVILLRETNAAAAAEVERLRGFVKQLQTSDPGELYVQQLEENALSESTAGMGFLTMINDYDADLAWRFEALADSGFRVTTQVTIRI
ncbi:hypothetical protein J2T57_001946 [Natronocella acetinitrilica]|uniref:ATP-binding protein n=1 Tax=Natronocella acetinitrilica TaxID=414046 RepID=A0AAE3KCD3_9GAMM|nr:DUF6272 family protein [Natronocella acetinitrilica]MCP1674808.1 hypothetical protein [Natronocella acetinitrilica]